MDDETYVHHDPTDVPGRPYYHSRSPDDVPAAAKVKSKAKFPKKLLVWQCLNTNGNISKQFISIGTLTSSVYLQGCLKKRLLPFIDQHYQRDKVIFWSDLAACHYANIVTNFLRESGISFVERQNNAPNVPQARPIERFWVLCKQRYSSIASPPKTLRGFKHVWNRVSREVATESGTQLRKSTRSSLVKINKEGVYSVI